MPTPYPTHGRCPTTVSAKARSMGPEPACSNPAGAAVSHGCTGVATRVSSKDRLAEYRSKRDLARSGEPRGSRRHVRDAPRVVRQRHDATPLHIALRLQVGDALVSWAVPKGPSLNPRDKRLAVRTEDHPLDYIDFEGTIGEDQYGSGTVVVWDTGTYRNLTERDGEPVPMERAVEAGHVLVWLKGHKIAGGFALTRTRLRAGERRLLVKKSDEGADRRRKPATTQPETVLTGRTNKDLADEVATTDE